MYNSKYYTCEQIDQRLLEGYYDDAVAAGYTGSKAQYLAELLKAINYSANPTITADKVVYNPAISGLTSKNVQGAVDELQGSKINKTSISQESGDSEELVMSQKAVSAKLSDLSTIFPTLFINVGSTFKSPFKNLSIEGIEYTEGIYLRQFDYKHSDSFDIVLTLGNVNGKNLTFSIAKDGMTTRSGKVTLNKVTVYFTLADYIQDNYSFFTGNSDDNSNYICPSVFTIENINKENIKAVSDKVNGLENGKMFLSLNKDGYVNTDGAFVDSVHFKNSGYIPLALIDNIEGSLTESTIAYTISYYDENLNFLGGNNLSDRTLVNITSLSAPESSKYVLLCQGLATINNYSIYVTLNKSVTHLNDFFDFKKEITNKITSFTLFRIGYKIKTNSTYNPRKDKALFCLNSNIAGDINSISVKTIANSTYNIYKVNRKTKTIKLLSEVEGGEDGGWKSVNISEKLTTEETIGYICKTTSDNIPIRQEKYSIGETIVVLNGVDYDLGTFRSEHFGKTILLPLFITGVFNYSNDTVQNITNTSETLKSLVSTIEDDLAEVKNDVPKISNDLDNLNSSLQYESTVGQNTVVKLSTDFNQLNTIWGLNSQCSGKISSIDIYMYSNTNFDVFKVNRDTLYATKIGSVSNSESSRQIQTLSFETPVDIKHNEFIGILCLEESDKIPLGNDSSNGFYNTLTLQKYNQLTGKGTQIVESTTWNIGIKLYGKFPITGQNFLKLQKRVDKLEDSGANSKLLGNFGGNDFLGNIEKALITDFDYAHVVQYGQSLSDGTEISKKITVDVDSNVYCLSPNVNTPESSTTLIQMKNTSGPENPLLGTMDSFARMYKRYISDKQLFIGTSHGVGGRSIEQLSKNTRNYSSPNYTAYEDRFIAGIQNVKSACDNIGKSVGCVAIIYYQGESNYASTSKDTYKERLINLKNDMQSDIMSIYGQSSKPLFFVYGGCGQRWISNKEVAINMAIWEAAQENDDIILMGPVYQYPEYWRSHLSVNGNRMHGEKTGEHLWNTLVCNSLHQPLHPIDYRLNKDEGKIEVDFYVPYLPLVFDTNLVQEIPNYGFKVFVDNIEQSISSVEIVKNTVSIKLTSPISGTAVEINYGGYDDNLVEYCGTGNLRDSSVWKSMYEYWDDTNDLGTYFYSNAGWENVIRPSDADTYQEYQYNHQYSIGDKVKMNRNGSNIYVKATKNGLLEPPYHQVVHRPKDANGIEFNKLIKNGKAPKYPMYNWCINFYHKFKF